MDSTRKINILSLAIGLPILGLGLYLLTVFPTFPVLGGFVSATGMSIAYFGYKYKPRKKIQLNPTMKTARIIILVGMAFLVVAIIIGGFQQSFHSSGLSTDFGVTGALGFVLIFAGALVGYAGRSKQDRINTENNVKPKVFPETGDRLIGRYVTIIGLAIFLFGFIFLASGSFLLFAACFFFGFIIVVIGALMRALGDKPANSGN